MAEKPSIDDDLAQFRREAQQRNSEFWESEQRQQLLKDALNRIRRPHDEDDYASGLVQLATTLVEMGHGPAISQLQETGVPLRRIAIGILRLATEGNLDEVKRVSAEVLKGDLHAAIGVSLWFTTGLLGELDVETDWKPAETLLPISDLPDAVTSESADRQQTEPAHETKTDVDNGHSPQPNHALSTVNYTGQDTECNKHESDDQAARRLLSVFTNGLTDERFSRAATVLQNDRLTSNEKLTQIDDILPFPATTSAEHLGRLLGVSKQAVLKTKWWTEHRKGEKANQIGRRRDKHRERAEQIESFPEHEDER